MRTLTATFLLACLIVLAAACSSTGQDGPDLTCVSDIDCAPTTCCDGTACMAKDHSPDCRATDCSPICGFGTAECGVTCFCKEGQCGASPKP